MAAKAKHHYWGGIVFHISSTWVIIRLHTKIQLPRLPGSGLKCNGTRFGGVGCGGYVNVAAEAM